MRPTRRPDRSAVLVLPNVKIRLEPNIPSHLSLHDVLRESVALPYVQSVVQGVAAGYTECAKIFCAPIGSTINVTMNVIVIT